MTMIDGNAASIRAFTPGDSAAPPDAIASTELRSGSPFSTAASMPSTSGRPNASPTISTALTPSDATVSSRSSTSRWSVTDGSTIVLPLVKKLNATQCAAPCMNGGPGRSLEPPDGAVSAICSYDAHSCWSPWRRPPMAATKMSAWRHMTPLGMPVVPPV